LKSQVFTLEEGSWAGHAVSDPAVVTAVESGDVIYCPRLAFTVEAHERALFTAAILGSAKNASYDAARDRIGGTTLAGAEAATLRGLMHRFSDAANMLVERLFTPYRGAIVRARASFRPAEIAGRVTSWRKDDTRLHVDAFPATPSGGRRILRVFSNVNPNDRSRVWRIGDDFEAVARRFSDRLKVPLPGVGTALALLRITKTPRSAYDALMLQLHDRMKGDSGFQAESPQTTVEFPPGTTWMAFTDQVSHAATSGQYQLEQTFLLPVAAMRQPERSPLRILERLKGRTLV
jgi:3-deoxy-D-manno-octulosonic acid hydroxylase-like protein